MRRGGGGEHSKINAGLNIKHHSSKIVGYIQNVSRSETIDDYSNCVTTEESHAFDEGLSDRVGAFH